MKWIPPVANGAFILALLTLAYSFSVQGFVAAILPLGGLALIWFFGAAFGWGWAPSLVFTAMAALAAAGIFTGVPPVWSLLGLLLGLSAWDLRVFHHTLSLAASIVREEELIRRHMNLLAFSVLIAAVLGALALRLQTTLHFGLLLVLATITILGLSRGIQSTLREKA